MTYQFDRHESSAAQKTDDELFSSMVFCREMIRYLNRQRKQDHYGKDAKQFILEEMKFYYCQWKAILKEIKKRG